MRLIVSQPYVIISITLNWNREDILSFSSFFLPLFQLCSTPVEGPLSFCFLCLTLTQQCSVRERERERERERASERSLIVWNSWADIATVTPLHTVLPQSLSVEKGYYLLQTEDSFRSQKKRREKRGKEKDELKQQLDNRNKLTAFPV